MIKMLRRESGIMGRPHGLGGLSPLFAYMISDAEIPVLRDSTRDRSGEGLRMPMIICDRYDLLIPQSLAIWEIFTLLSIENCFIGCMADN